MRFFTTLFFLCLLGLTIGFGALAMWDMPQPTEQFETKINNERFFGTESEKSKN